VNENCTKSSHQSCLTWSYNSDVYDALYLHRRTESGKQPPLLVPQSPSSLQCPLKCLIFVSQYLSGHVHILLVCQIWLYLQGLEKHLWVVHQTGHSNIMVVIRRHRWVVFRLQLYTSQSHALSRKAHTVHSLSIVSQRAQSLDMTNNNTFSSTASACPKIPSSVQKITHS
jgi:hypothetical protein